MPKYRFSTIKLVPDLVRDEPINIGVVLHDLEKKVAYHKITENWAEVRRRTRIDGMPELGGISESGAVPVDDEYLDKLSHKQFQDSLVITEPVPVAANDAVESTLSRLFQSQISLPDPRSHSTKISKIVDEAVKAAEFPAGSCKSKYTFSGVVESKEFPYVFLKGKAPHTGIFYLSLDNARAPDDVRARMFDIHRIRESPECDVSFEAFCVQDRGKVLHEKSHVRDSISLSKKFNLPVVYRDEAEDELRRIRSAVS